MISRPRDMGRLQRSLARAPVTLLVGARQTGKTTLARALVPATSENYFDLENPQDLARLSSPMLALEPLTGLIVIDEIRRRPELFPALRVLADRDEAPSRFLILGSASPHALRQASESLAGRVEVVELGGLSVADVGAGSIDELWLRGGFPRSYLAGTLDASARWRAEYIRALASRDLPEFGLGLPAATIERFLGLVAFTHGQQWNSAEPARGLGIGETTVRKYIDTLADALLVRVLQPWHANIDKRQIRSPRVYLRDSGLLHTLLGIDGRAQLMRHPRVGASWEGAVVEEVLRRASPLTNAYYWRTSGGAELDLLLVRGDQLTGIEIKRTDAPKVTPSMRAALSDLRLDRLTVVYPGQRRYQLAQNIEVVPYQDLAGGDSEGL